MLDDDKRAAGNALRKAWSQNPHPDLAAAFAEIEPEETPSARIKRFASLIKRNPEHEESRLLQAELALADQDFPAARRAIRGLIDEKPRPRVLTVMAAVEKGEGAEDKVVHAWLNKALAAPRGPQWICSNCSKIHNQWAPICDNCSGFDTFDWKEPQEAPDLRASTPLVGLMPDTITGERAAALQEE